MAVPSDIAAVSPILTKLKEDCATPEDILRAISETMAADMVAGLDGGSELPMIPSYVNTLPNGKEKGVFYAMDLGGTNFRVLRVQLGGEDKANIRTKSEKVKVPEELMRGTSEKLYNFMASRLAKFIEEETGEFHDLQKEKEIGFTFSFPVKQTSIASGTLIKWTKGYAIPDAVEKDVVVCLNEAIKVEGLNMRVSALVNDTVATLAGARYWDNDVMISIILGTGTNASYVERINKIPKLKGHNSESETMVINTEWGAFKDGLPLTQFDIDMDEASHNSGEQIFEKKISGMYLGEIVRRVLVKMTEEESLFDVSIPGKLSTPFALTSKHINKMHQDESKELQTVESILLKKAGVISDLNGRNIVREVIATIVKRGGRLAGAGIVGILQKMENDTPGLIFGKRTVVAVDGCLYEKYPQYVEYLKKAVTELVGENMIIQLWEGASGIGAALLAATNSESHCTSTSSV